MLKKLFQPEGKIYSPNKNNLELLYQTKHTLSGTLGESSKISLKKVAQRE